MDDTTRKVALHGVVINDVHYPSIKAAATALAISYDGLRHVVAETTTGKRLQPTRNFVGLKISRAPWKTRAGLTKIDEVDA